jgi:hypothetical protein
MESRIAIIYIRYVRSTGRSLYGNTNLVDDTSMTVSSTFRAEYRVLGKLNRPLEHEMSLKLTAASRKYSSRDEDIA